MVDLNKNCGNGGGPLDNVSPDTKRLLTGAAIGAVIAIPLPFVGPIIGGLVGAGIAHYRNTRRRG